PAAGQCQPGAADQFLRRTGRDRRASEAVPRADRRRRRRSVVPDPRLGRSRRADGSAWSQRRRAEIGAHIFPDDLAVAGHLKNTAVMQQAVNADLRSTLGSAAWAGFISYLGGTLCMLALAVAL